MSGSPAQPAPPSSSVVPANAAGVAAWLGVAATIAQILVAGTGLATVIAGGLTIVAGVFGLAWSWQARTVPAATMAALALIGGAGLAGGGVTTFITDDRVSPGATSPTTEPSSATTTSGPTSLELPSGPAACTASPRSSTESAGRICSPANGARIQQAIEAKGAAVNIPAGHQLWLFVVPADSQRYLPGNGVWKGKEQSYLQVDDGTWGQGDLELGSIGDSSGAKFALTLVDLGPNGIQRLRAYLAGSERNGMERAEIIELPDTRELDTIQVERA